MASSNLHAKKEGNNNSFCSSIDALSNDKHIREQTQEINAEQEKPSLLESSFETKRLLRSVTINISKIKDDLAKVMTEASKFMDFKVAERDTAKKIRKNKVERQSIQENMSREQEEADNNMETQVDNKVSRNGSSEADTVTGADRIIVNETGRQYDEKENERSSKNSKNPAISWTLW